MIESHCAIKDGETIFTAVQWLDFCRFDEFCVQANEQAQYVSDLFGTLS
jgi:hypothetical protein